MFVQVNPDILFLSLANYFAQIFQQIVDNNRRKSE